MGASVDETVEVEEVIVLDDATDAEADEEEVGEADTAGAEAEVVDEVAVATGAGAAE